MFFDYRNAEFRYEPYPIGIVKPVIEPSTYRQFTEQFPPVDLMSSYAEMGKQGQKYTLSEKENGKAYEQFVSGNATWREFHRWIKSHEFIYGALDMLKAHDIDLGYRWVPPARRVLRRVKDTLRRRQSPRFVPLTSRFEFSALPADGGSVVPHTDAPSKIVTMVVAIVGDGEWERGFGGGLDVNRPRSNRLRYNQVNRLAGFDDMEVVHTYDFQPNQVVVFVKTYNSWHSVRPMQASGSTALRRTLTIVIETAT